LKDDSPIANPNTNSGVEGAVITGFVLPNDSFGADGPTATSPAGGVVGVRAAGGNTTTPVTTGTGTQITGLYGKLTLNADGSYSYDGDPNVISGAQSDVFVYTIRDADGDLSTTTLTINLTPVTLVADNDTVAVNEAGLDLVNDAGPDTVAGTVNGSNPTSNSDVAQGTLAVAGATNYVLTSASGGSYGTMVLNSNGTYTYTLTKPFDTTPDTNNGANTETGKDVFNYTATDANGNSVSGTITVDIIDDVPLIDIAASGTTLLLDESLGTAGSIQNEGGRVNNDETLAGAAIGAIGYATGSIVSLVSANAGADGEASRVYSLTVNNATSGLVDAVTNSNIVLVSINTTTVEGRVGSAAGAVSFRITVDPANGTATINQFRSVEHNDSTNHDENGGSEALMNSGVLSLGVALTDGDGDRATDTVDISQAFKFEDDGPAAIGESGTTNEILVDFNTAFVIDFSGSIDNSELNTQLVAVKAAINELFNSTGGNVSVKFVLFATSAMASATFTSAAAANSYLDSVNPATGGTRPGAIGTSTDFSDAITTLLANYAADETANNQVFFLSDGNPNQNTGSSGQALNDTIRPLWNSFVNDNDINVTAIGVGGGINNSNLQQIDVDGAGAPILVANFDDLIDTLTALFAPTPITGDLDINDDYGTDGGRILSIAVPAAGTDPVYTWNGVTGAGSQITVSGGGATINGATSFTATTEAGGKFTFDFATGQWSYTPPKTVAADTTELFNYTIVDGDGDTASATLSVLVENNDLPATAPVTATVDDDALSGNALGSGDLDANAGEVPASASEAIYNGTLNITATDNPIAAISFAQLQGTTSTIGQETVTYSWNAVTNLLTATIATTPDSNRLGDTLFTVQLNNPSNGSYTVTLVDNVLHSNVAGENDASVALTYRVADTDGSTNTGVLNITFDDDTPAAYTTAPGTATGPNVGGTTDTEALNLPAIGADSPGALTFTVSGGQQVLATNGSALTYNGQNLFYNLKTTDSSVLEARTSATPGAGTLVFSIDLNAASGPTGQYVYTQNQQLSTAVLVPVTNLSSVGGGNVPAKAIDVPSSPYDIVLTTKTGATVNTNASEIGVGSGQSLDDNDVIRIDFVNVTVTGSGGSAVATFNEYYSANAFRQDVSGLSGPQRADFTVKAIAIVNNANGQALPADGDNVFYGDTNDTTVTGTTLNIYNASGALQTTAQLTAAGVTVTNMGGGVWRVLNLPNNYDYEIVSATTPFQAVQVDALTGTDTFKLGILSTSVLQVQGATFSVPIQYTDADGDFVSSTITINLSAPAAPVVLDLDGDGAEFVATSAGVAFDYFGDGDAENTAWAGADDGILAVDHNGDGNVNNGSEIVFGGNGLTDLQGLAAHYDSNQDGVLDANDADFAKFGVWQDANSNGVTDAGEYQSLTDAGIVSINLVSDGIEYAAADGDVTVHGTSSYTKADGTTGDVADASFATGGDASKAGGVESKVAANENDQRSLASASAGMAGSMVAAGLVAAVAIEHDAIDAVLSKVGSFDGSMRTDGFASLQSAPFEATSAGDYFTGMHSMDALTSNFGDNAIKSSSFDRMADIDSFQNDSFGADHFEALSSNLLAPTELDHGMFNMSNGASMGMVVDAGSQALIALQDAGFAQNALQDVVADALAGGAGQGANVDALLNALAGPANEMSLLGDSLAQTFGDNAVFEALSFNNGHDMFDRLPRRKWNCPQLPATTAELRTQILPRPDREQDYEK
jgi:VCBS repeat-containing protein